MEAADLPGELIKRILELSAQAPYNAPKSHRVERERVRQLATLCRLSRDWFRIFRPILYRSPCLSGRAGCATSLLHVFNISPLLGQRVKTLEVSHGINRETEDPGARATLLMALVTQCPNLEELWVHNVGIFLGRLFVLARTSHSCLLPNAAASDNEAFVPVAAKLRYLHLSDCHIYIQDAMPNAPLPPSSIQLEMLVIQGPGTNFHPTTHAVDMPNLRFLSLQDSTYTNFIFFDSLKHVEYLEINGDSFIEARHDDRFVVALETCRNVTHFQTELWHFDTDRPEATPPHVSLLGNSKIKHLRLMEISPTLDTPESLEIVLNQNYRALRDLESLTLGLHPDNTGEQAMQKLKAVGEICASRKIKFAGRSGRSLAEFRHRAYPQGKFYLT